MNLKKVASQLRVTLLMLTAESRLTVLHEIGICNGCGADLMNAKGEVEICHCRNDE